MFDFKNKKSRICFFGMLISLAVMLVVFFATDGLLGDKEFSEYTSNDWSIAILPLSIIILSCVSTLVFALIIIIPMMFKYPALVEYLRSKKFHGIDFGSDFLAFDHNEFKRACCDLDEQGGLWFSVKEYDLKTKTWKILEAGRYIDNANDLVRILQEEYKYDRVKFYDDLFMVSDKLPPRRLPLTNIEEIDESGILYVDNEESPVHIQYSDAYKGWCKSKNIKKSDTKYICDRTKNEERRLVFHINPQIIFYTDISNEELWFDTIHKINLQGYAAFDFD